MKQQKLWQIKNDCLFLCDVSGTQKALDNAIYNIQMDDRGNLFLRRMCDKFEFDFKIYGMESDFITRLLKTYKNTSGNLGAMCNGVKGTGGIKSIFIS